MFTRNRRSSFTIIGAALLIPAVAHCQSTAPPEVESLLIQGKLSDAQRQLQAQLATEPENDDIRFALGVTQTLQGLESLMQSLYRYGLNPPWQTMLPFVRLPVPTNPKPDELTNHAFRQLIENFARDLASAESTLAKIDATEVKLLLHIGLVRLDFDSDGRATVDEALWKVLAQLGRQRVDQQQAEGFVIAFDKGDVHWLRGYISLLQAWCELFLAYDTQELHDYTAQLFFPTAKVRHEFLMKRRPGWWDNLLDGIAFIHLVRLPVVDTERFARAHEHLLRTVEQSRASWSAILAETDDQHEWIPSPTQKNGVIPNMPISQEMIAGWHEVLDELEAILNGEKLVPFWRDARGKGVNLQRVFTEPRTFDLVLWVQGVAAAPYLEKGEVTDRDFWRRIQRGFRGQFFWFALWVN